MRLILTALALATAGCSAIAETNVGYARSLTAARNHDGVALDSSLGLGIGGDYGGLGAGLAFRNKFSAEYRQFEVSPHLYLLMHDEDVGFLARTGLSVIQADTFSSGQQSRTTVTAGSPFGEIGVMLFLANSHACGVQAVTSLEYARHAGADSNEGFWKIGAGLGCAGSAGPH
jgi:hypothetical protein